jgi:hypothetical protein
MDAREIIDMDVERIEGLSAPRSVRTNEELRLEALRRQARIWPQRLRVRDERLHRLLARAGAGGSY